MPSFARRLFAAFLVLSSLVPLPSCAPGTERSACVAAGGTCVNVRVGSSTRDFSVTCPAGSVLNDGHTGWGWGGGAIEDYVNRYRDGCAASGWLARSCCYPDRDAAVDVAEIATPAHDAATDVEDATLAHDAASDVVAESGMPDTGRPTCVAAGGTCVPVMNGASTRDFFVMCPAGSVLNDGHAGWGWGGGSIDDYINRYRDGCTDGTPSPWLSCCYPVPDAASDASSDATASDP